MRILLTLGLTSLALLSACKSEEQILKEARTRGLEQCNSTIASKGAPPGFDTNRFCTCLMDKTLAGKSVADIEKMDEGAIKSAAETNGAACAAQQMPAAPAAPVPQETGAEAAEEATDEAQ